MNGTLVHNGSQLVLQAGEFTSDPRQGWRQTIRAIGLTGPVTSLGYSLAALGYKTSVRNLGDGRGEISYELNSLQNSPEVPQDLWQLPGTTMQKNIYEHPKSIALDLAYPGILKAIQDAYNSNSSGNAVTPIFNASPAALTDPRTIAIIAAVGKGQDHFDYSRYGLKHTQTVSQVYGGDVLDSNSENIYTTAQLLAECAEFPIPLPTRMANKIQAIDDAAVKAFPAPAGYVWGWKKDPSTETTVANYKIEIVTDYAYDLWNTYFYAPLGTGTPEV